MAYFIVLILIIIALCLLIGFLSDGNTALDIPEIPPYQPMQKQSGEKFSFRESYLHRNDAKRERRRRNQWPL